MTSQVDRHYIRCADCLSIGVIEGAYAPGWHCSLCAGAIELMGRVVADKQYESEKERSACDRRCTHAVGPICVCRCLCANHGTGRVVRYTVVENITTVQFIPDEQAQAFVVDYRTQRDALVATLKRWRETMRDYSIPYEARRPIYYGNRPLDKALHKAIEARTWKARHKHLQVANAQVESVQRMLQGGV